MKQPEKLQYSKKMNRIQEKLVRRLFHIVKEKYPEIDFLSVTPSPEDSSDLLINILTPFDDDEKEWELKHFAGEISTDILIEYGYLIGVMTRHPEYADEYRIEPRRFNINEAA